MSKIGSTQIFVVQKGLPKTNAKLIQVAVILTNWFKLRSMQMLNPIEIDINADVFYRITNVQGYWSTFKCDDQLNK